MEVTPNLRAVGLVLLCAINISLALLVIQRNRHSPINRLFCLSVFAIVGWIATISLSLNSTDTSQTLLLGRFAFAFASVIPFGLLSMFQAFETSSSKLGRPSAKIAAFFCCALVAASLGPWVIHDAVMGNDKPKFIYGPLHPFFAAYFVICFGFALYTLAIQIKLASGVTKLQLRYLLLGVLIAGSGAITTNLLVPLIWKTSRYSVLGPYFSLILVSFSAHAIIRHHLMDIKLAIRKGVVYGCSIAATASIFMLLALLLTSAAGSGYETIPLTAAIAIAVVVAIVFQPIKRWLQTSLNRYVYRETYDYQRTIREVSTQMSTILDLQSLLTYLGDIIDQTLKVETIAVYLQEHLQQTLTLRMLKRATTITRHEPSQQSLSATSPLIAFLEHDKRPLLREDARRYSDSSLSGAAQQLAALGGDIALPFTQDHTISGLLIIGPKLSGDPYFVDDIDLLSTLASQAAIAIKNAGLYQEVVLVNEYVEHILATMESAVIAVAANGNITLFNSAAERMTGLQAQKVKGTPVHCLPLSIAIPLEATTVDSKPRTHIETTIYRSADQIIPAICSTSPVRDRLGTSLGAVAVFSDLTRIKQLEGENQRAERLASIGAIASGLAHEIKNPLVAIRTFAELLPDRFSDEDFRNDFAQIVIREIDRIDDLVARLRGLATKPAEHLTVLDVRTPLYETLALLRGQLEQAQINTRISVVEDPPLVVGDHGLLKQLFLNLFMNAIESIGSNGELSIGVAGSNSDSRRTVVVEIKDTGPGIPEELLGRIFDPFITTKKRGSGLGLSICRGIADAHRAVIRAQNSDSQRGAKITIEFPAAERMLSTITT